MRFLFLAVISFCMVACQSAQKVKPIIFPELNLGSCPDGSDRMPSSLCRTQTGGEDDGIVPLSDDILENTTARFKKTDLSLGKGFSNANHFAPDQVESIMQGSPDQSFWTRNQVVEAYPPRDLTGAKNKSGTSVLGTPTRVYVTKEGQVAYIGFDNQAVSLMEVYGSVDKRFHTRIPGQGQAQHPKGFSTPVGRIKGIANHSNRYTADELGIFIGKPGTEVKIEFESGVVVTGVIDKYTTSTVPGNESYVTVVSFVDKTCEVTFGSHKLFRKSWGIFDMLLMPEVTDSLNILAQEPR